MNLFLQFRKLPHLRTRIKTMALPMSRHRLAREQRTLECMLRIYCRGHHGTKQQLCPECRQLLEHALSRLLKCPFGAHKPACGACPNNCHAASQRDALRMVMRFAGPRMVWRHPVLALRHLWDSKATPASCGHK